MSEAEKPNKKDVCEALLEGPWVFVHLDPRREGVIVPAWFKNQPQLVLQLGLNMAIPIPDLEIGDEAITCTLSFSRQRHFCRLPWSAIYALLGDDARGMVWPEDVPPEVAAQSRAQKQPKLTPVETSPKIAALPKPAIAIAPEPSPDAAPAAAASKAAGKKGEPKPKKPKAAPKPKIEAAPKAAPAPLASVASEGATSSEGTEDEAPAAPAKKTKRELPPYLRVIK